VPATLLSPIMSPVPSPAPLPPPSQNFLSVPTARKQKSFTIGIAAGAEDAKYQAKYKELKRKVKDIEAVRFSPFPFFMTRTSHRVPPPGQ